MACGGGVFDGDPENSCFKCKLVFEDVKAVIQCTACKLQYHGKCGNVDMRGFRMKKATWKCEMCEPTSEVGISVEVNKPERSRKRSRMDDYIDANIATKISAMLQTLVEKTTVMEQKFDLLLAENHNLKAEMASMKAKTANQTEMISKIVPPKSTYASAVTKKENKILVVKQSGSEKDKTGQR